MTLEALELHLEGNLIARPCTLADVEAATEFFRKQQLEENGKAVETVDGLRADWETPLFDLEACTRGVFDENGVMIAFAEVWDVHEVPVHPGVWFHILPEYRTEELGLALGQWTLQTAHRVFDKVPAHARIVADTSVLSKNQDKKRLLEKLGFESANRSWYHMAIEMTERPPQPEWSDGIRVSTLAEIGDPDRRADVLRAANAAFRDHRGYVEQSFETSLERLNHRIANDPLYDPSVYYLAMDGDKIVGVSLCRAEAWEEPEEAYVLTLGVVPEYRRRGIALAMLHHTFCEYYDKGQFKVGLHVDGASLTGATRLYEKAGMHVTKQLDAYTLVLREGEELSKQ